VVHEPLLVDHAQRASGDDTEMAVAEPHDREIGLHSAVLVEERGVDDAADGDVGLVDDHPLHVVHGPRPLDVEDGERAEVHHADPVAHRQVLGVDDGRPPARVPLGGPDRHAACVLVQELPVRLVPVRPLPAGRLEEHGVQLDLPRVEGAEPDLPVRRPLLRGVHDAVGLVVPLPGAGVDVGPRALVLVEAGDVRAVGVDLGHAARHPLGHRLGDPGGLLDPDGGGRPQAPHLGGLAEDRRAIRRE
jgi:hypothetical protein